MKLSLFRCLKAVLIVCGLWAGSASALDANKADIGLNTTINGNNVMQVTINPGGQGCSAGTYWDIVVGGCTSAVQLRTESTSRSCSCSCPELGSCSAAQSGTYPVFGWRLPTSGQELISYYGATSWGACVETSNSCVAAPVTPPSGGGGGGPASIGTTYSVTAMICDGSDPNYYAPPADTPTALRNMIIGEYRDWLGGRCPEASGYMNWVSNVNTYAYQYWGGKPGVPDLTTYISAYYSVTRPAILVAADQNGERTIQGVIAANTHCQRAATEKYGPSVKAEYVFGSGNQCIVTAL